MEIKQQRRKYFEFKKNLMKGVISRRNPSGGLVLGVELGLT